MWTQARNATLLRVGSDAVNASPSAVIDSKAEHAESSNGQPNSGDGQCRLVPIDHILIDPENPRRLLRDIDSLSASISAIGIIEPLVVTPCAATPLNSQSGEYFQILSGHRRYEAAKRLGRAEIEVIVRFSAEDQHARLRHNLICNIQRDDLTALELAQALQSMLDCDPGIHTQQDLAAMLGKDKSWVSRNLRILGLPQRLRAKVAATQLPISQEALAMVTRLKDEVLQEGLIDQLVQGATQQQIRSEIRKFRPRNEPRRCRQVFVTGDSMSVIVECRRDSGALTMKRVLSALENARKRVAAMMVAIVTLLMLEHATACPPHYTVQIINGPNCGPYNANVAGLGVNSSGDVCGRFGCPGDTDHAFMSLDGGPLIPLTMPAGTIESRATTINDRQTVVGTFMNANMPGYGDLGFVWDQGALITILPPKGGTSVDPADGNNSRVIVGAWGNVVTGPYPLAFRWQDGILQDISNDMPPRGGNVANGISENGLITGYMGDTLYPPNRHAFIWDNGKVTDLGLGNLPACFATEGHAINDKGHVCGFWWRPASEWPFFEFRGFFYDGQSMADLGTISPWPRSLALDINNSDAVVGYVAGLNGAVAGVIWKNGMLTNLNDAIDPGTDIIIRIAYSINSTGQIVGKGEQMGHVVGVLLTPQPWRVPGDVNCDHVVNVDDLLAVINHWGPCVPGTACPGDWNEDGIVDHVDLLIVLNNWTA